MDSHFPYSFVPWCITHVHLSWPNPSYSSIPSHFIFPNKVSFLPLPQTHLHFQTFPQIYQARCQWISALGKHFIVKAQQGARLSGQSNAQDPAPASIWQKTKRQSLMLLLQMLWLPGRQNSNGSLLFRHRMRSRGQRSRTGSEERPSQQNQSLLQPSDQCLFPTSWLME